MRVHATSYKKYLALHSTLDKTTTNLGKVRGVLVDEPSEDEVGLDGDAAPRHARLRKFKVY